MILLLPLRYKEALIPLRLFLFFFYAKRSTEALCLRKGWLANCLKGEYNDSIL